LRAGAIGLPSHLEMASMQALIQHTADQREAMTAFLEKRKRSSGRLIAVGAVIAVMPPFS
jgi:hypothetical protein